jgi:hypothetical protein
VLTLQANHFIMSLFNLIDIFENEVKITNDFKSHLVALHSTLLQMERTQGRSAIIRETVSKLGALINLISATEEIRDEN